jgi:hypothetical protein
VSVAVLGIGAAAFLLAWARRSLPTTMAAAGVTSAGMVAVPVELAVRGRLAKMHKGVLLLGAVMIVQGLHTVEHIVQLMQSYRLDRVGAQSLGVVSRLNVEWVHFGWNWIAWAGVVAAWRLGTRGRWMPVLFVWITAHSLEHTYMLVHYLRVLSKLDALGLRHFTASEVLPGILGRDGWLSLHWGASRSWLGPLTASPRVAIHFWWNVGEMTLLTLAVLFGLRTSNTQRTPSTSRTSRTSKPNTRTPTNPSIPSEPAV